MMTDRESAVAEQIAFAAADTVLFFAPQPKELVALQRKKWLPVIERVNGRGSNFTPATGLEVPVLDNRTRAYLKRRLDALDDDSFAAFCQASGGLKSVILALSVLDGGSGVRSGGVGRVVSKPFLENGRGRRHRPRKSQTRRRRRF